MSDLPTIPAHLPAWQGPHLAWLASYGLPTRYAVPDGVEPTRADLSGANLSGANLTGADLTRADLTRAYLTRADLTRAYLSGANLTGANLAGATGVGCVGPVGDHRRMIYAVRHGDGAMIQAGCWWGDLPTTLARIGEAYADRPGRDAYLAAVRVAALLVGVSHG